MARASSWTMRRRKTSRAPWGCRCGSSNRLRAACWMPSNSPDEPGERPPAGSMSLRPIIAIVGRPNVGKSTLFNRLVGRRRSIVRDVPGVTRDRLYGQVSMGRWHATAIDTGGFDPSGGEPLIEGVRRQVLTAVEEAD